MQSGYLLRRMRGTAPATGPKISSRAICMRLSTSVNKAGCMTEALAGLSSSDTLQAVRRELIRRVSRSTPSWTSCLEIPHNFAIIPRCCKAPSMDCSTRSRLAHGRGAARGRAISAPKPSILQLKHANRRASIQRVPDLRHQRTPSCTSGIASFGPFGSDGWPPAHRSRLAHSECGMHFGQGGNDHGQA